MTAKDAKDLNDALRQASRVNEFDKIKSLISRNADVNSSYVCTENYKSVAIVPFPMTLWALSDVDRPHVRVRVRACKGWLHAPSMG